MMLRQKLKVVDARKRRQSYLSIDSNLIKINVHWISDTYENLRVEKVSPPIIASLLSPSGCRITA